MTHQPQEYVLKKLAEDVLNIDRTTNYARIMEIFLYA